MSRKHYSTKLFYKYYMDWIKLYKEKAVRKVTLDKYYLTKIFSNSRFAVAISDYFFLNICFMRCSFERTRLRSLSDSGVTSRSSSSLMNSIDCSRLSVEWGTRRSASSLPAARVFVICFFLQTLQTISSFLEHSPTIMPS